MNSKITLSKMKSIDIPLIKTWLAQTYIQKWLGDPTDWLEELENKDHTFDWIHHFPHPLRSETYRILPIF